MTFIDSGQNVTETGKHILDNWAINFDPTLLNSSTCSEYIPYQLTGKYVLAEECTRFVYEHCAGKLRFFMFISGLFLFLLLLLMYRHKYFEREKKYLKKEKENIKEIVGKGGKNS